LIQIRSSFLTDSLIVKRKDRSFFALGAILFSVVALMMVFGVVALGSGDQSHSLGAGLILILIFGIALIAGGWQQFSLFKSLEKAPKVKMNDKNSGLGVVQGTWIGEKELLTSPLAKKKCIFYQIELQELHSGGKGGPYWETIATCTRGVPVLLTDGMGYSAPDLSNARLQMNYNYIRHWALNSEDEMAVSTSPQGTDLIRYVESQPYEFDPSTVGVELSDTYKSTINFRGSEMSVLESAINAEDLCYAVGNIVDTGKSFNKKPVKAMVYDAKSKILRLGTGTEVAFEHMDKIEAYASFAIGALLIVGSLAWYLGI
jgi:hypothetical protein